MLAPARPCEGRFKAVSPVEEYGDRNPFKGTPEN